jgi:hypothetical protein
MQESIAWLGDIIILWNVLFRWILLLTILGFSYLAVMDYNINTNMLFWWSDLGMWAYVIRMIQRAIWDPPDRNFSKQDFNILFVGNSYTGYYELHKMTRQCLLAGRRTIDDSTTTPTTTRAKGGTTTTKAMDNNNDINVEAHFPGGQTFEGHLNGLIRPPFLGKHHILNKWLIRHASLRNWKWIILQNHSLQPGYSCHSSTNTTADPGKKEIFDKSVQAAQQINDIIVQHNPQAQTLFFMTWGRRSHYAGVIPDDYPDFNTMQEKTAEGYQQYVAATSTRERPTFLAPVGLVFRTIYNDDKKCQQHQQQRKQIAHKNDNNKKDPSIDPTTLFYQLLDCEGHHPSLAGSYTAAVTIYATLTGNDATQLQWKPNHLKDQVAVKIRDAVQRTIQETVDQGTIRYPWQDR